MPPFQILVFSFLAGICSLQLFSELPSFLIISLISFITLLITFALKNFKIHNAKKLSRKSYHYHLKTYFHQLIPSIHYLTLAFLVGFWWMWGHCVHHLGMALPESIEGEPIVIVGTVVSLPERMGGSSNSLRFEFQAENTVPKQDWPNPGRIRLYLQDYSYKSKSQNQSQEQLAINVGDKWQFKVKLKRPFNYATPGSFDKEKYFFQNHWHAEGSVIQGTTTKNPSVQNQNLEEKPINKKIESSIFSKPLEWLRSYVLEKMRTVLKDSRFGEVIIALVVGIREGITSDQWQVFRDTGTAHLMAISGLHIGLMAGFSYFCVGFFWRRLLQLIHFFYPAHPLLNNKIRNYPVSWVAAWGAILGATTYALLAGFSIPTQRALIMSLLFMAHKLFRRSGNGWQNYSLALLLVLLLDPFSTLSAGFWLSFGAVGVILYGMQNRLHIQSYWWKWGRIQWVVFLGLAPFTLAFFQKLSMVSPFVNSLAIPWVSFMVVPLALLGTLIVSVACLPFLESIAQLFLILAERSFSWIWPLLEISAHFPKATWIPKEFSTIALGLSGLGAIILLLPRGSPAKYLGLIWCLPMLINQPDSPNEGKARFFLLDVGQGLAAVVETAKHVLVFDTGPNLNVLLPFLTNRGIQSIDTVIISHGDHDHIGGLSSLLENTKVKSIITSEMENVRSLALSIHNDHKHYGPTSIEPCYVGQRWNWDGVEFEILHPETVETKKRNDHSCVLRLSVGNKSVLLTGDIEVKSEIKMLERSNSVPNATSLPYKNLSSTVLVVPHHGSRSSSSLEFIQAINPEYAIIPVGYRNSYGHPKKEVVDRYQTLGIKVFDTVHEGTISFLLEDNGQLLSPECYRIQHRHFWQTELKSIE